MHGLVGLGSPGMLLFSSSCVWSPGRCRASAGTAAGGAHGIHGSSSSSSSSSSSGSSRHSSRSQQPLPLSIRTQAAVAAAVNLPEDEQQQIDELHRALEPLGCPRLLVEKLLANNSKCKPSQRVPTAIAVLHERISHLLDITQAVDSKQHQRLFNFLAMYPGLLNSQPATLRSNAGTLQQEMQQQFGLEPEQVQTLIGKHPKVLKWRPNSLIDKMVNWCELLALQPAEVLALWIRKGDLVHYSMQLLAANLASLQDLLQLRLHMPPADVLQLAAAQPTLLKGTAGALKSRLDALQECFADWAPQQLGAALPKHPSVLERSPDTIRYKWRVLTKYREVYMLCTQQHDLQQQQQQEQQQQQHSHEAPNLGVFTCTDERYAMLEYIMERQKQQQEQLTLHDVMAADQSHASGASSSSSSCSHSSHDHDNSPGAAQSRYMPPFLIVLKTRKQLFARLVSAHYPGFWQWYKQRQQAAKEQHRPPDSDQK